MVRVAETRAGLRVLAFAVLVVEAPKKKVRQGTVDRLDQVRREAVFERAGRGLTGET